MACAFADRYDAGDFTGAGMFLHKELLQHHHNRLRYAYEKEGEQAKVASHQKTAYDQKTRDALLLPGEWVLVRESRVRDSRAKGRGKLTDWWEGTKYVIVHQPNSDLLVYIIKPESGEGLKRVLRRN